MIDDRLGNTRFDAKKGSMYRTLNTHDLSSMISLARANPQARTPQRDCHLWQLLTGFLQCNMHMILLMLHSYSAIAFISPLYTGAPQAAILDAR